MKRLLSTCFIALYISASAQGDYFNTEVYWKKLQIVKQPQISPGDTAVIMVSSRAEQKDPLRFMGELRDGKQLRYFLVYVHNEKLNIFPVKGIEEALSYLPDINKDWVIYTEGMGKLFTTDIYRSTALAGQYDVNVIMLDYPSITTTRKQTGNYYFAINNARIAYKDFEPVINKIKELKTGNKLGMGRLSMFYHSMGNNVLMKIMQEKQDGSVNKEVWVDNLILNAPCVPQGGHCRWLDKVKFAKRVYIHYNPDDYTLSGAHLMSLKKQLGEKVLNPVSKKAVYINFNALAGRGHSNFLSLDGREPAKKAALDHYRLLLHGDTVALSNRKLYAPTAYNKIGWDILP